MVLQERLHALGALCLQLQAASCSAAHPPSLLAAASRDSRHGRHFADDVANGLARGDTLEGALHAAVARWQGWRIGRRTARETGIPAGMPQLTGYAIHFEILADA